MKKYYLAFIVLMLLLTACAPQEPTEPPSLMIEQPNDVPSTDEPLGEIEDVVAKQLAENLGLDVSAISLLEKNETEFSDGCLDVAMADVMCAQVITPGYIILLEADGIQYEYHVSVDGSRVQPATLALTWSRDGGFAGFCDRLTIYLSGEIYGNQCKDDDGRMGTLKSLLSVKEQAQLFSWVEEYGASNLDASDPKGTADGMSLIIDFHGLGKGTPGKSVRQDIFAWAQDAFLELYK